MKGVATSTSNEIGVAAGGATSTSNGTDAITSTSTNDYNITTIGVSVTAGLKSSPFRISLIDP